MTPTRSNAAPPLSPSPAPPLLVYRLPALPHLRLRFTLVAHERARLPPWKGSLLRGAFGHALRRTVCTEGPNQPCARCHRRGVCVQTRLFETFVEGPPPPFLGGLDTSPRPYVFEPSEALGQERTDFAPGDPLTFDLVLFGRAAELQAFALVAVDRMADAGLGSRRHRFRLERAEAPDAAGCPAVFTRAAGPAATPLPPALPAPEALARRLASGRATLRFLTPFRLKKEGRLADGFSFRELAFRSLRRALELAWFHVPGASVDWEFHSLLERASAVALVRRDLRWHEWERWSNRQRTSMLLGGLVGEVDLEGDLTPFAPLLATAQVIHVGKGTTFGLGRIEVV